MCVHVCVHVFVCVCVYVYISQRVALVVILRNTIHFL